jgi:hypothetical protein
MMARALLWIGAIVVWLLVALGVVAVSSFSVQVFHDSCRYWTEPPAWASFCPPSTRHGVK